MKGWLSSVKNKMRPIGWVALSVAIGAIACVLTFSVIVRPHFANPNETRDLYTTLAVIIGVLAAAVLFLSGLVLSRHLKECAYINRINSFTLFFDSLQKAAEDIEIPDILYNFLRCNTAADGVTVFYGMDASSGSPQVQKLSNMEMPLCAMCPETCPVISNERDFYMESLKDASGNCPHQLPEYKTGSFLCLPLDDGKAVTNVIQLFSRKEYMFKPPEIAEIKSYMAIVRSVLIMRRTMYSLSKKATTDTLTKLYNRSFLDPYLENQIEAANLSNQEISVIMVDMDHFKSINDTYGHAAGDYILTVFARVLLSCIRKTDMVARYGGDEFIVVLPSTNTDTAKRIAERIRQEVAETRIPPFKNTIIPPISCSVGVSTYPAFCNSKDTLLITSDLALYTAKQSGRNCTRVYEENVANA